MLFHLKHAKEPKTLKASALSGATLTSTNQIKHIAPRDDAALQANNMALLEVEVTRGKS